MPDNKAKQLRTLIQQTWARRPAAEILAMAQQIDATMTQRKLSNLAYRLRQASKQADDQVYFRRVATKF